MSANLLVRAVLLDPREADFERRGFRRGNQLTRERLTAVGTTFIAGYNAAWTRSEEELGAFLDGVAAPLRGFAFEGAAMALMLGDVLLRWRRARWSRFAAGPAEPHVYLALVGAGWCYARTGMLRPRFGALDPLLRWLVYDGAGFHDAYFDPTRTVRAGRRSGRARGAAAPVYDQGIGRALWFVDCAEPQALAATVASFAPERRADLWSGVALAATYAGGADAEALRRLRRLARGFEACLAQGSAFGAQARRRAGALNAECETAARVFCDCSAGDAALVTSRAAAEIGDPSAGDAYARWRAAVRARFAGVREAA